MMRDDEQYFLTAEDFVKEVNRLKDENNLLRHALMTIAGGHTEDFPGGPDVMAESPDTFRHKMWSWSQEVARSALASSSEI